MIMISLYPSNQGGKSNQTQELRRSCLKDPANSQNTKENSFNKKVKESKRRGKNFKEYTSHANYHSLETTVASYGIGTHFSEKTDIKSSPNFRYSVCF